MPDAIPKPVAPSGRMPSVFLGHGSPYLLDDAKWVSELSAWSSVLPRPSAILVLSAHWVDAPLRIGATRTVPLVYDFYGFPKKYYDVRYAPPGAPDLASRIEGLLRPKASTSRDDSRGLDHGAYVPLIPMYPGAETPVLQVSLPSLRPSELFLLGQALAPLRSEGVLLMGSGFLTHNMRAIDMSPGSSPPSWAREFDAFCKDGLERGDVDALLDYRAKSPAGALSHPTDEHLVPLFVAMGAAVEDLSRPSFPIEGFTYGSFSKRSVQFG